MTSKMKHLITGILVFVLVAGASFYGGMQYQKSQTFARGNFMSGNRQFGMTGTMGGARTFGGANAVMGSIVAKDASSISVSIPGGGSKIILLASSTEVTTSAPGSLDDLTTGTNVIATGATNSDGSLTASMIRISSAPSR